MKLTQVIQTRALFLSFVSINLIGCWMDWTDHILCSWKAYKYPQKRIICLEAVNLVCYCITIKSTHWLKVYYLDFGEHVRFSMQKYSMTKRWKWENQAEHNSFFIEFDQSPVNLLYNLRRLFDRCLVGFFAMRWHTVSI